MGSPINRAPLTAAQTNLVNGEVSDAPVLEAVVENAYDYVDGLNAEINAHTAATTLPHADGSVTASKIRDGAVTEPKLATGAVSTNKLAENSIITSKIQNNQITEGKMASGSVSSRVIANQAVQAQHINPAVFAPYPDSAVWVKFADVDSQLADLAIDIKYPPIPLVAAIGDGVTNDTIAIQEIINSTGTKKLLIPVGTFLIDPISFDKDDLVITGVGAASVIKLNPTTLPAAPIMLDVKGKNIIIENVKFVGANISNMSALWLSNANNVTIKNCVFEDCRSAGIRIGNSCYDLKILYNRFENPNAYGGYGIVTHDATNLGGGEWVIDGSWMDGNNAPGDGIELDAPSTSDDVTCKAIITNNRIKNYAFSGSNGIGIGLAKFGQTVISNNLVVNCGLDGIHLEDESRVVNITNNIVLSCKVGILVGINSTTDQNSVTIIGNEVKNCTAQGILVQGVDSNTRLKGVTVVANSCDYGQYGISMIHVSNATINSNVCSFNSKSGIDMLGSYLDVAGNILTDNTEYGLNINSCTFTNISRNVFRGNGIGNYNRSAGDYTTVLFTNNVVGDATAVNQYMANNPLLEVRQDPTLSGNAKIRIRPSGGAGNKSVLSFDGNDTARIEKDNAEGQIAFFSSGKISGGFRDGYIAVPSYNGGGITGYLWLDATGDLRVKNGIPTSDTDGTIVGTQS